MAKPSGPILLSVPAVAEGQRLDNFLLRQLKGVPRSLVYRLVRKGAIRVNGRRVRVERRVSGGDEIRVPPLDRPADGGAETPVHVPDGVLRLLRAGIIHEDDDYLVLDKPAGLAVHGGSGLSFGIIEAARLLRPGEPLELGHRLDRETSGCLVLTKSRRGLQAFHEALRAGHVAKRYLALVAGRWQGPPRRCDLPIAQERDGTGRRRMRAVAQSDAATARSAISLFTPVEPYGQFTLVAVDIGTGRTHQIRVHGGALGHPVAGDHDYGNPEANRTARAAGLQRMFLHAQSIRFPDWQGEERLYSAPLPDDLQDVLQTLAEGGR
ncbi:RluA family pseudouridine synthase [Thioalkalivibrio sp.]|uniref:RluA family pseudouridine synthase n=1 Tax=Thioalkalivibrio sp. TaxID=2093813 RepID=UPI003561B82F